MVPVVPLFGTLHLKEKYWLFLKNKDRTKNGMDKIWDRNPSKSEVIGRCGGDEKTRLITLKIPKKLPFSMHLKQQ